MVSVYITTKLPIVCLSRLFKLRHRGGGLQAEGDGGLVHIAGAHFRGVRHERSVRNLTHTLSPNITHSTKPYKSNTVLHICDILQQPASLFSLPFPLFHHLSSAVFCVRPSDFQHPSRPCLSVCLSAGQGLFHLDGGLPAEGLGYGRRVHIAGAHFPCGGRERGVQPRSGEPVHQRRHPRDRSLAGVLYASGRHHRLPVLLHNPEEPAESAAEHHQQRRARAPEVWRSGSESPQQTVRNNLYSVKAESTSRRVISLHANVDGK